MKMLRKLKIIRHKLHSNSSKIKTLSFRQNSLLNLIGGGLMAIYALLGPAILARALDEKSYSAYILGLQIVPFLFLLATPLQTSIGPKFARNRVGAGMSIVEDSKLIAVAAKSFCCTCFLAIAFTFLLSFVLPVILSWDTTFKFVGVQAIRYLGISASFTIPAFLFTSYAAGNQNFLWDNVLKCLGPYLGLILIFAVWQLAPNEQGKLSTELVIWISSLGTILGSSFVIFMGFRKIFPFNIRWFRAHPFGMRKLLKESGGAYWMQVCAVISVGTGPLMVSTVELESVPAYAVAVSTMAVIAGVSSVFSAPFTMQIAQSLQDSNKRRIDEFRRFHVHFMMVIYSSTFFILVIPQKVFDFWLGDTLGPGVHQLLIPLAIANLLRQITSPYTAAVLGIGKLNKIWLSPAVEAALFVILGLLLGHVFGSKGVAYAFLMAAAARLIVTLFYDLRLTRTALPLFAFDLLLPRIVKPNSHLEL
jgi:O-antigen/teichoic acid export membrane protein